MQLWPRPRPRLGNGKPRNPKAGSKPLRPISNPARIGPYGAGSTDEIRSSDVRIQPSGRRHRRCWGIDARFGRTLTAGVGLR